MKNGWQFEISPLRSDPENISHSSGRNGAGKTTLVKLLCRLYDPLKRAHHDRWDRSSRLSHCRCPWRRQRGVSGLREVSVLGERQHRFGREPPDVDLSAVTRAAKQAGVHETIERLPKGYESVLGKLFDGGHELSIGEWQKVALARAVLRDSQILILDEPTSAMDAKAEANCSNGFMSWPKVA